MYFQLTTTGAEAPSIRTLHSFLERHQFRHPGVEFDVQNMDWHVAWPEQVRIAISKTGAHLSEVGAPWVSDFVSMNCLRRFTAGEVDAIGGAGAFFPAPWSNVVVSPSSLMISGTPPASAAVSSAPGVYALPGRVDVRMLYYWKDMLADAGVDEATAFRTPEQVEQTLECLRARGKGPGAANPWIYQGHATRNWVYNMASWIWAYGGDFVDEFGLPVFDRPEAIDGMTAFFRLHRFAAPAQSGKDAEQVFSERRTAMAVLPTFYHVSSLRGQNPYVSRELLPLLGAARLPGPAFVGGTCFVIWQHASPAATRTAVALLTRFVTSSQMAEYCYGSSMLPSRVDGLDDPEVAADPFLPVLKASLESGRTNKSGRLWMPIADRLSAMARVLSAELREDPNQDVRAAVERHVRGVAERLRMGF